MSSPVQRRALAEADAIVARERATRTLSQLRARLSPRRLAREAVDEAQDAGTAAARAGIEAARRHAGIIAGAVALVGLFAARGPVSRLFDRATRQYRRS